MSDKIKNGLKEVGRRFLSPVTWLAVTGLLYSVVIVPSFEALPEWTSIAGIVAALFGVTNNPTDGEHY